MPIDLGAVHSHSYYCKTSAEGHTPARIPHGPSDAHQFAARSARTHRVLLRCRQTSSGVSSQTISDGTPALMAVRMCGTCIHASEGVARTSQRSRFDR
jgi:hypothetical protein